jgi:hypothetical protein
MSNLRCMHGVTFPAFCDKCNPQHGTGEVEEVTATTVTHTPRSCTLAGCRGDCGICSPVNSRSVQRREALQKGEPMPEFDKPEMPERIWAWFDKAYYYPNMAACPAEIDIPKPRGEYLRADKVREAIKKAIEMDIAQGFWLSTPTTYADYDIRKKDYQLKKKQFANIVISLFPEGLGGEE